MTLEAIVGEARSGVVHIVLERDRVRVGSGTGFLLDGYVLTASHVLRRGDYDTVLLRFDDQATEEAIRYSKEDLLARVHAESPEEAHDFLALAIEEAEFENRHRFDIRTQTTALPGAQTVILGFPFETTHLAAHVAYVAASFEENGSHVIQLDGSVNPSNSGGPVIDPTSGVVVAMVVRAQTGLLKDFDELVYALKSNIDGLTRPRGASMSIGGIDPVQGLAATMTAMHRLALNMRRSANVGIGYAHSIEHARESLALKLADKEPG